MSESQKLTQQEIDALLEMLPHEHVEPVPVEDEKRKVQVYDFRSPAKYSKGHIWALQIIHETLAKRMTSSLSIYLQSRVQVTLSALDQGTYAGFIAEMPNPSITYILSLSPLPGRIVMALTPELAATFIERMLGGTGLNPVRSREVTEMELALVRKIVERILSDLMRSWEDVIELSPVIEAVVMNPLWAGVAFPTDAALLAKYEVFFEEVSSVMNITIPFSVLDPIAQRLSSGAWASRLISGASEANDKLRRQMAIHLAQIKIPLCVHLNISQLNLDEIAGLRTGEVLLLDTHRDGLAKVFVGGRQKYWGRPGIRNNRMAVLLEQVVESSLPDLVIPEGFSDEGTTNDQGDVLSLSTGQMANDQQPARIDQDDSLSTSTVSPPPDSPEPELRGDADE